MSAVDQPLFIPVLLGTVRQGRLSEQVARFVYGEAKKYLDLETEFIDIRDLRITDQDAGLSAQDPAFAATMNRADGLIIVTPEYNHSYPGILKHVLDTNHREYYRKAVGFCGVSQGSFAGTRAIEALLSPIKAYGMVPIQIDLNFGEVEKTFDSVGNLLQPAYHQRLERFLKELIWMATTLKYGRLNIS